MKFNITYYTKLKSQYKCVNVGNNNNVKISCH